MPLEPGLNLVTTLLAHATDSRVPTRRLDQSVSWFYSSALLSLFYHAQGYSVLDAAASVEELAFCVDFGFDAEGLGDLVQLN